MAGPEFPQRFGQGGLENTVVGPILASAATIAPTYGIHHVSGTAAISLITPPWTGFTGQITLIPDEIFSLATGGTAGSGPIAAALTAVVNSPITLQFDGTSWFNVTGLYGTAAGGLSYLNPLAEVSWATISTPLSTLFLEPLNLQVPAAFSNAGVYASFNLAGSSASSANASFSINLAVYTRTGSTLSRYSSTQGTFSVNVTGTSSLGVHGGLREISFPFALSMNPGQYWYGYVASMVATDGAGSAVFANNMSFAAASFAGSQSAYSGILGGSSATNQSALVNYGGGAMSVSTATPPASIAFSALSGQGAGGNAFRPVVVFRNYTV